jgi:predicted RNA binding protein YcfA (HicA-like mRNA interferase family)
MSQRLPNLTARQVVAALKRGGFRELRQKGGHLHLIHPETDAITTIPRAFRRPEAPSPQGNPPPGWSV